MSQENCVTTKYYDEKVSNCWLETEGVGGGGWEKEGSGK